MNIDTVIEPNQLISITVAAGAKMVLNHGAKILIEEFNDADGWVKIYESFASAAGVVLFASNPAWRVRNCGDADVDVSLTEQSSGATVDNATVNAAIAEDVTATRNALGIAETSSAYIDFNVTMEPLFSGSYVQEGEFTPPTDWQDILIVTQVDIPYMSAGAIAAALQIKTTNGANVIPWAIPVETSGSYNGILDPRVTVVRLQRAGAAVMLNVYMANSSHQDGQFMNEMNGMYQPPAFADYGLGDGSGGGYGGYGGGTAPIDEMIGIHWQNHTFTRVDGRAISACVFHEYSPAGLGDFLLRFHTTQFGSVESLNVRILAR